MIHDYARRYLREQEARKNLAGEDAKTSHHQHVESSRRSSNVNDFTALPSYPQPAPLPITTQPTNTRRRRLGISFTGKKKTSAQNAAATMEAKYHESERRDGITALPNVSLRDPPAPRSRFHRISDQAKTKVSEVSRGIGRLCSTKSDREPEQEASVPHDQRQSGSSRKKMRETLERHTRRVLNRIRGNFSEDAQREEMRTSLETEKAHRHPPHHTVSGSSRSQEPRSDPLGFYNPRIQEAPYHLKNSQRNLGNRSIKSR